MKFRLEIELENDAMQYQMDVALALHNIAVSLEVSRPFLGKHQDKTIIRDENGNTVGFWHVEE